MEAAQLEVRNDFNNLVRKYIFDDEAVWYDMISDHRPKVANECENVGLLCDTSGGQDGCAGKAF